MEAGEASDILALAEYGGVRLAPEQRLLTPFQRMVILLEAQRQQDEAEKEKRFGSRTPNTAHQAGGGTMHGETVEYVNTSVTED